MEGAIVIALARISHRDFGRAGLSRLRENPSRCHPEEAKPVLSIAKEGPLYLFENSNTEDPQLRSG
jgi:hypothetical protein